MPTAARAEPTASATPPGFGFAPESAAAQQEAAPAAPTKSDPSALASAVKQGAKLDAAGAKVSIAQPSATPATGQEIEKAAAAVARGLTAAVAQRGGSLTIRLIPETLGFVRVQLDMAHGSVSGELHASTPQARDLLEANLPMLRSALESRGLIVDRLAVALAPSPSPAPSAGDTPGQGQSQQHAAQSQDPSHDAAERESRGRGYFDDRGRSGPWTDHRAANDADGIAQSYSFRFALNEIA